MIASPTTEILQRLLILHHRSLPMYLRYAQAERQYDEQYAEAWRVLMSIVADQEQVTDEIGELLIERNVPVRYGEFPIRFTAYHDLSFAYLVRRLIEQQLSELEQIRECVSLLTRDPLAQALAERALGAAKAHLEALQELQRSPTLARL